jgi:putative adhesin Stv-like protein
MANRFECGKSLYIFTNADKHNPTCVIDSHGFRPGTKPYFQVPAAMTIKFYVNRHRFLMVGDEEKKTGRGGVVYNYPKCMDDIAMGIKAVEEKSGGDQCPNYLLSKQQKGSKDHSNRYDIVDYKHLETYVERRIGDHQVDIVTVRNRFGKDVYLDDVLKSFIKHGFNYSEIRCSFCRGGFVDALKDKFGWANLGEYAGGKPA